MRTHRRRTLTWLQVLGAGSLIASVYLLATPVPSSGAVAATATPDSNVRDQDVVHVHATGLPARTVIKVLECTHGAISSSDCDAQTNDQTKQTNAGGDFDLNYTVFVMPNPIFAASSITCDDTHDCELYVGVDFNDFTQPKAFVAIHFAAGTGTTTTTTTPSTTTTTTPSTTTTTSSSGTTTTSTTSSGSTTTTTASSGTATTTTTSSSSTAATSSASTTTTLGPLGAGFGATVVQAPPEMASDSPSVTAGAGQTVTVAGRGFERDQDLPMTFRSTPIALGTTRADAAGAYRATVTIPAAAEPGQHRIVVSGRGTNGAPLDSVTFLTVTASAIAPPGAIGLPGQTRVVPGPVAFTGARLAPWLAMLGLLALFGGSIARRLILRDDHGT